MKQALETQRRDFLFSVRPEYAELIVDGTKTVELRRRFTSNVTEGSLAVIYCTSPIQAIIGVTRIASVECLPLAKIWSKYRNSAKIKRSDFDSYFSGCTEGFAILLTDPRRLESELAASKLRKRFGFTAPQSFVYLPSAYYSLLGNDQLQAAN